MAHKENIENNAVGFAAELNLIIKRRYARTAIINTDHNHLVNTDQ